MLDVSQFGIIFHTYNTKIASIQIKIKDFSTPLNELFRWMLVFLYKDIAANYFWENFREEVFVNDKGEDFKVRLGTIKAVDMKYDEFQRTEKVLMVFDYL
jgi:hypothetical protein